MNDEVSKKKPFWKRWWFWLIIAFLAFSLIGSAGNQTGNNVATKSPSTSVVKTETTKSPQFIFDVPSLVNKKLEEVISILGQPKGGEPSSLQIQMGVKEWDKTFTKNGKELLVTYSIPDKKIIDFFVSTDNPSGITQDKSHLLELGNVREGDPNYSIEFVKAIKDPNSFTGVKIIPH